MRKHKGDEGPAMTTNLDVLPLTAVVGDPAVSGVEIYDNTSALHMTVVERHHVAGLDPAWDRPGAYVLLERPDTATGIWGAYTGKAPAGVTQRMKDHVRKKKDWYRALLIRRDTTHGFNSAEAAWLEGRLYDLLNAAEFVVLRNENRPIDETLSVFTRNALEGAILPISRTLVLVGHDPSPANTDEPQAATNERPRTSASKSYVGVTLKQMINAGVVMPGPIVSANGAWPADALISQDGSVVYNDEAFATLSAAACRVRGIVVGTNGWDFWAVLTPTGKVKLSTYREKFVEMRASEHIT